MAEQLPIRYDSGGYFEHWNRRVLAELGQVTAVVGLKEMAFFCDAKASTLAHALAERDQRQFQSRWLGPFLQKAPTLELARALVEPAGLQVAQRPELTPEQQLLRLREAISEICGPMIVQAIDARARR